MLLLLLACTTSNSDGDVDDTDVPETCDPAPSAAWDGTTAYEDHTDDWGLTAVHGGRMEAADVDNDGYPDLMVTELFSNTPDDLDAGLQYHFLMMNREVDGRRTFVDETAESGLITSRSGTIGTSSMLHVFADVDNDGDLDVFAGHFTDQGTDDPTGECSEILLNDGTGHFTYATASDICIVDGYPTAGVSFTDYDGDGVLDLWITGWYVAYGGSLEGAQDHLYHGNGDGTFTDVTNDVGLKLKKADSYDELTERDARRPAYGATACDVDGDTLPDLLASNYGRSWNHLWHNDGGAFTEIGEDAHFDADTDLTYTDNLWYACYCESAGNCDPAPTVACGGAFPDNYWTPGYDDQPSRLAGNTFTTVCQDIDNDGDLDLYSAEIHHKWAGESGDSSQLLLNDGTGIFERIDNEENGLARRRPQRSDWNEGDLMAAFLDFDNDGWKDIFLISSDYPDTHSWLWRQTSPGQFEEITDDAGIDHPWPAGVAVADFDRDGDLDVVTGSSTARSGTPWTTREVHFYENVRDPGNWLRIDGLPPGTRVDVRVGDLTQTQEVSAGYGHMGIENETGVHFGLGDACMVDEITATRPGGQTKTWTNKAGNRGIALSFEE